MEPERRAAIRLWKEISPPISFTSRWVMTSPSPVPPWRRGDAGVGLAERLEQTRLIAFRNPDTGIVDLDSPVPLSC